MPFYRCLFGGGSPTKTDYRKKGTLIPTSLLEGLVVFSGKCKLCLAKRRSVQ